MPISSPISSEKPRVDFIVPGFSKCGTTSLCQLLAQHKDIFIPSIKEANFFVNPEFENHWKSYRRFFSSAGDQKLIGEGGTFYTGVASEDVARKGILKHYPDIKLVFIARDPIDRLESSYRELHHSGPKFGVEIPFSIKETLDYRSNFLDDTRYWSRLCNYSDHMDRQNIHVLLLEDLNANPSQELGRCFEFLGVDADFRIGNSRLKLNKGSSKYYDSMLLRKMRKSIHTGPLLQRIGFEKQKNYGKYLGLRKRFRNNIEWDRQSLKRTADELAYEVESFLEFAGKPVDVWPRFKSALEE